MSFSRRVASLAAVVTLGFSALSTAVVVAPGGGDGAGWDSVQAEGAGWDAPASGDGAGWDAPASGDGAGWDAPTPNGRA